MMTACGATRGRKRAKLDRDCFGTALKSRLLLELIAAEKTVRNPPRSCRSRPMRDKQVFSDRYQEWLQSYSIFFEAEGLQSPEAGIRDRRQE